MQQNARASRPERCPNHYDYLAKSGFSEAHAEAPARLLERIEERVQRPDLRADVAELRTALDTVATREDLAEIRAAMDTLATKDELAELRAEMLRGQTRLVWAIASIIPVLAALRTLIELIVG